MKRVIPLTISVALLAAAAAIVLGKGKPPSQQDSLICDGIQGSIQSDPFTMKGTYEGGSWTSTKLCRIWPEKGDAQTIFTYPDGVSGLGQIWQLDRDKLMDDPRCGLNILMDDGNRPDETRIALAWARRLDARTSFVRGGKGAWILRTRGSNP